MNENGKEYVVRVLAPNGLEYLIHSREEWLQLKRQFDPAYPITFYPCAPCTKCGELHAPTAECPFSAGYVTFLQ